MNVAKRDRCCINNACSLHRITVSVPDDTTACISCGKDLYDPADELIRKLMGTTLDDLFGGLGGR